MLGRGAVGLAGAENGAGKFGFVGRIGIVLGFKAQGVVLFMAAAAWTAVKEVGTVELHSRLGGVYLHHAPAGRLLHTGGKLELALLTAEHEAVVVALCLVRVLLQFTNPFAYGVRRREVERRALNRG